MADEIESMSIDDDEVTSIASADVAVEEPGEDDELVENDDEDGETPILNGVKPTTRYHILPIDETYKNYYEGRRTLLPIITKFERAKLIGVRAQMIASGSVPLVEVPKNIDRAYDIAVLEYNQKKIPLLIRRYHSDGKYEDWRMSDLIITPVPLRLNKIN
jgi:DNA-directed RNA polymerase subunit K/omega